jgi:hypothetical protein
LESSRQNYVQEKEKFISGHYAGSEVELLATGGDSNAAATPVFFSALLRNPKGKSLQVGYETMEHYAGTF